MFHQRFFGERRVLLDNKDLGNLSGFFVGNANGRAFQHAGVACHHVFDLVGVNVEAGDENHVLLAIDDLHKAALVHHADVTGLQGAVGGHRRSGFLRPVPVAFHHLRAGDADFADAADGQDVAIIVADGDDCGGNRQADGAGEFGDVDRIGGRHGGSFGEAVAFENWHTRGLVPALGHRALHGHATGRGKPERGEIYLAEIGMVEQGVVKRVETTDGGEFMGLQFLDETRYVARIGNEQVAAAVLQHEQTAAGQRVDVIQRQRRHHQVRCIFVVGGREPCRYLLQIGQDVPLQQHGALGDAGGAARVLQEGNVVRPQLHRLQRHVGTLIHNGVEFHGPRQIPGRHHFLHRADDEVDQHALET